MKEYFPLTGSEILSTAGAVSLLYTLLKENSVSTSNAAIIAILIFIIVLLFWSIHRIWRYEGNRFKLEYTRDKKQVINVITRTKYKILTTHFTSLVPSDSYTSELIDKAKEGIELTRIIDNQSAQSQDIKIWLEKFQNQKKYSEYVYSGGEYPLDFSVFDEEFVVIYLPGSSQSKEFNWILTFRNKRLASIFSCIFEILMQQSHRCSFLSNN